MASTSNPFFQLMYDIFLSFRGLDTRKKFTDHLYKALKLEGFRTFRDDDVIERGENIKSELRKAIRNSRMSVIVLSKNYANSTACLFEIRTILEHRMESDHWILPVFYEVDPWEIKEQAKSLDFREKKVTVEEVKGWRAALKEVASMAGMVSQNQCDGYEAKFIENIVGVLKSKLTGKHRRVGGHIELDKSMQNLKRKVQYLSSQENDINAEISRAKRQPWKRPKKEVEVWLRDVQQLKDDVQRLEQEAVGERNVFSHALLGKHVVEKIQEVSELQEKGRVFNGLLIDEHPIGRLFIPLTKDFVQSTKARNTENVWECLMNDEVGRVGIYGMGGVGKTTIMKHIHNRLLEETGKFDSVFWVTVSKEFDPLKLQKRIAKALYLNLVDDEDETIRASELYAALSQKKYVLILDDLWEAFPLDSVGIPEPNRSNGCKLVLTTRSLDVCRRMDCTTVKVELLTEQEALTLFLSKATGHDIVLAPDVEDIACLIAKECACLPLAIVTVAGSLRGLKGTREWRNALNGLISLTKEVSDGEREVFEQLKFSYNRLGDEVLKDCFLYCSMYPEDHDIPVEELIEYWIAEGLIGEMKSVEAKFDRGHTILGKLTSCCLLESSTDICGQECLRMHDLIRDMALRITASRPRFLVKAGEGLESVLYEDWLEDLERISLMHNDISELPIRPPVCPRLTTLLLKTNNLSMIPESFFTNMRSLVVLDLSDNQIQSLPESISNLEKLHALILGYCPSLEYVPSLEKLIALKVFKLNSSLIDDVPKGIEKLVNLRELDLSCNARLEKFPGWMLRRLSKLQYLRMDETSVKVSAEDLLCLRQLKVVSVQFQNVQELTRYVTSQQCQGLEMYRLVVGKSLLEGINTSYETSQHWLELCRFVVGKRLLEGGFVGKEVCINTESEPFGSEVDQLVLPRNIGSFELQGFHNLISLSAPPSLKDAKNLTKCCVGGCSGLESIFSSSSFSEDGHISLRTVESCCLFDLPDCRVLFDGLVPPHNITFNLKELCFRRCQTIKNIFPVELLQNFPNLSRLEVDSCENVEDIIVGEQAMSERGHHREDINKITLPRLQNVILGSLSRLKSIYTGMMVCECLQEFKVVNCPMVRRLPLSLDMDSKQATAPPIIEGEEEWWESLEWDEPHTKTILDLCYRANFEHTRSQKALNICPSSKVQELINASHKIQLIRSNGW
ncbi:putative disease resistance protein At4g10780 isoform X2 [Rhododendron vialii]|uniref:putative disease resistance protein At4g10780 isoform X2 n=1 Tax=Rhododendron vialii TaxID=182163 RepID=UPI00265FDF9A|nr:putative disease resistance protein At4g10780 isoform X2 [Rhododendron vialii]